MPQDSSAVPEPVDGKFVFEIASNIRVRFNSDGWAEEYNTSTPTPGTKLQGSPSTKLDDLEARRYYDLIGRVVLYDIHSGKTSSDKSAVQGIISFKDIDPAAPIISRINLIIAIANKHFGMGLQTL